MKMLTSASKRLGIASLCYFALTLSITPSAKAGDIDFDDNPISFTSPTTIRGTGQIMVNNAPNLKKLNNGYTVENLSYTLTATNNRDVSVAWSSGRIFNLGPNADVTNTIFGNTNITINGNGTLLFLVQGTFDGNLVSKFDKTLIGPQNNLGVNWNESGVKSLFAGNHLLDLGSQITYLGGAAGDTITVTSEYSVIASVPEPSSTLSLLALGTLGAASTLKRKLKPSNSSEKETTKVS